jgi:plasmid stabilization system protein ParE
MRFTVSVLERAWTDADRIFEWIAGKSARGAISWNQAFAKALVELTSDADQHGIALESAESSDAIRQKFFKTRRGRPYRILFTMIGNEVRVLRVRGPGQSSVTAEDVHE